MTSPCLFQCGVLTRLTWSTRRLSMGTASFSWPSIIKGHLIRKSDKNAIDSLYQAKYHLNWLTPIYHNCYCKEPQQWHEGRSVCVVQYSSSELNCLLNQSEWGRWDSKQEYIKKILQKMTETYRDWHEKLPFAFARLSNFYSFFHRSDTIFLGLWYGGSPADLKVQISSLRI